MEITSFDMHWKLVGIGSARLTWIADHETIEIGTTYVGDGLQSLMQAAVDLHHGSSASVAWLSNEPHAHVFLFSGASDYAFVQIIRVRDENAVDPWATAKRCWAGRIPLRAFTAAATRMAQDVLHEHGDAGYRRQWRDIPFPARELTSLLSRRA